MNAVNQQHPDVFGAPTSAAPNGTEAYGWIYSDAAGNFVFTNPQYGQLGPNGTFNPGGPPDYTAAGWTATGIYHTHPFDPNGTAGQTDIGTGLHFSPSDVTYAANNGVTMYVAQQAALSDTTPESSALRWYSLNAGGRSETQQGLVGGNKC